MPSTAQDKQGKDLHWFFKKSRDRTFTHSHCSFSTQKGCSANAGLGALRLVCQLIRRLVPLSTPQAYCLFFMEKFIFFISTSKTEMYYIQCTC